MDMLRVNVMLPRALVKRIDQDRKDVARSRHIVRLLEKAMGIPAKERTEYD